MSSTKRSQAKVTISGRGFVALFLQDLLLEQGAGVSMVHNRKPIPISSFSMGIVSPTILPSTLRRHYQRQYWQFKKRYKRFVSGPSYRVDGSRIRLKKNSLTLDVDKLLASFKRSQAISKSDWTVLTGRNQSGKSCATHTVRERISYPAKYEGCSFAHHDREFDVYYKFSNGSVYLGADSTQIHQIFFELFKVRTTKKPRKRLIPVGTNGVPYVSIENNVIRTGDTGTHGILTSFIVAKQIADFILHSKSIRPEFLQ